MAKSPTEGAVDLGREAEPATALYIAADSWALRIPPDEPDEITASVSRAAWVALSQAVLTYEDRLREIALVTLRSEATSEQLLPEFRQWLSADRHP